MADANQDGLRQAVETRYSGKATLVQSVPVREMYGQQVAREATVRVYDLADNPSAKRAYAWSCEREDGSRRLFAVLHTAAIQSPADAVRAAMAPERKK